MPEQPTVKQLRYFLAVVDTRHFRRAAERMGVSQPSLSLQIGNLETTLGTQLLERGRGPVTLTPAGREIVPLARRAVGEVQAMMDLSAALRGGLSGTIRLGASPSLGPYLLPRVVDHLHRNFPDLRLYIREGAPKNLREELVEGTHDLILTQLPVRGAELSTRRLFRESLLLTVAQDHPLAQKPQVRPQDLKGMQMLSLGPDYILHDQMAEICAEHGAVLARDYEGTSLDALRQMVAMGMGATLLPQLYVASEIEAREAGVAAIPFERRQVSRSLGLVWRSASGAAAIYERIAAEVVAVAQAHFRSLLVIEG